MSYEIGDSQKTSMACMMQNFWQAQLAEIEQGTFDSKMSSLPLARIKKVMKTDEDVRMISADAPIVMAKSCVIFLKNLTALSWMVTTKCKRKTLQKNDLAVAVSETDLFDFLIDIIPREDARTSLSKKIVGGEYTIGRIPSHPEDQQMYLYPPQQIPPYIHHQPDHMRINPIAFLHKHHQTPSIMCQQQHYEIEDDDSDPK